MTLKVDAVLGKEIRQMLAEKGLETPFSEQHEIGWLDDAYRLKQIQAKFTEVMQLLGLDLTDDSLKDSPLRIAKMFTRELFQGCDYGNFPKMTTIDNKMAYDEMVIENGIAVKSFCEHHFITIDGKASVAYIPNKKVVGLSKLNRVVHFFCAPSTGTGTTNRTNSC